MQLVPYFWPRHGTFPVELLPSSFHFSMWHLYLSNGSHLEHGTFLSWVPHNLGNTLSHTCTACPDLLPSLPLQLPSSDPPNFPKAFALPTNSSRDLPLSSLFLKATQHTIIILRKGDVPLCPPLSYISSVFIQSWNLGITKADHFLGC